jgi:competence protein ComEC
MRLGKIYIDIVSPNDFEDNNLDDLNLNDLSVVVVIKYLEFEALLTGDIEIEGINKLVSRGLIKDVEYIKIPHHGSKNNITSSLLRLSKPEIAVISVGKNSYGHPNKETLDLLNIYKIPVMRTDEKGDIVIVSKGKDKIINVLE